MDSINKILDLVIQYDLILSPNVWILAEKGSKWCRRYFPVHWCGSHDVRNDGGNVSSVKNRDSNWTLVTLDS
jgi:hypothetical protein